MSKGPWLSDRKISRVHALLNEGLLHREIAEELGIERSSVSRVIREKRAGRPAPCTCGMCRKCRNREAVAAYQARRSERRAAA